jgi:DNA-binding HxlR family transcriptional regulator
MCPGNFDKKIQELSERSIEGINTRMLVKELKMLESNEIISRKAFSTVPPLENIRLQKQKKTWKNRVRILL